MNDFMAVYQGLERWGPGSESDTQKALLALPNSPSNILEIGCGNGLATSVLAKQTEALVTAVDTEQSALDNLVQRLSLLGLDERVQTHRLEKRIPGYPDGRNAPADYR